MKSFFIFSLLRSSVACQDKWCHTAVDANTWVSLVSVQLLLQCECVSVCGRRSGLRYQLPNTLPPLLPFHTGMFRIWMQERLSVWVTSPSVDYLWAAPVLTVLSSEWWASAGARCPPCCLGVWAELLLLYWSQKAVCVSSGVPELLNYPLSPRIVVFGT